MGILSIYSYIKLHNAFTIDVEKELQNKNIFILGNINNSDIPPYQLCRENFSKRF